MLGTSRATAEKFAGFMAKHTPGLVERAVGRTGVAAVAGPVGEGAAQAYNAYDTAGLMYQGGGGIAKLEEWIEENLTEQRRLSSVG